MIDTLSLLVLFFVLTSPAMAYALLSCWAVREELWVAPRVRRSRRWARVVALHESSPVATGHVLGTLDRWWIAALSEAEWAWLTEWLGSCDALLTHVRSKIITAEIMTKRSALLNDPRMLCSTALRALPHDSLLPGEAVGS